MSLLICHKNTVFLKKVWTPNHLSLYILLSEPRISRWDWKSYINILIGWDNLKSPNVWLGVQNFLDPVPRFSEFRFTIWWWRRIRTLPSLVLQVSQNTITDRDFYKKTKLSVYKPVSYLGLLPPMLTSCSSSPYYSVKTCNKSATFYHQTVNRGLLLISTLQLHSTKPEILLIWLTAGWPSLPFKMPCRG